jgi:23S rRNA pseudouridine1911/1915/1917 synthase
MPKKFSKPHLSRIINGDIAAPSAQAAPDKTRLDVATNTLYPDYSRASIQRLIKSGAVTVNGQVIDKPNYLLLGHETIELTEPTKSQQLDLPIIYQDDNVTVIDKPAGLLSMAKGQLTTEPTVADFVGGQTNLVHRLDRNTSGVMLAARNPKTKAYLQKQFQARKAHKTYYAIVVGHPEHPDAIINLPIARNLKAPTTFRVDPAGKEAVTAYKVLKSNDHYSLLELKPQTGRTHQLRVHLAYLGTPILGDHIYGTDNPGHRMMLHAHALEITIPDADGHGQRRTFTSPLPEDFERVFD